MSTFTHWNRSSLDLGCDTCEIEEEFFGNWIYCLVKVYLIGWRHLFQHREGVGVPQCPDCVRERQTSYGYRGRYR